MVPFPTIASVGQLYHFDPELSICKYVSSKQKNERNVLRAYPMRQSGCRRPLPGSPRRPFQPCSSAHSFSDCCHPTTCHMHEPPAEPRPPTTRVARQTVLRAFSIRDPGSSTDLKPLRLPTFGRDMSKALSGSSCATAKQSRKSSPACRIPAVIEPRRSITASVSTKR